MNNVLQSLQNLSLAQRKALAAVMAKKGIDLFRQLPIPRLERGVPLALSYAQKRLWFLQQLEPGSAAYAIPGALRLTGTLDETALQSALDQLLARHEPLRTRILADAGVPMQHIDAPVALPLTRWDLSALPVGEREIRLEELLDAEAARPFDLAGECLLRGTLIKLAPAEQVLALTVHHLVADGWSINLLIQELGHLYPALRKGMPSPLPPTTLQYADFAQWQRHWLESGEGDRQLAWWKQRLGQDHPPLALPLDRPRPAQRSERGGSLEFALPDAMTRQLEQLAECQRVTVFSVLLGAFKVLLYRYSGQPAIQVGVPLAGRNRSELEPLVGLFVNTQVLRSELNGAQAFNEVLAQVQASAVDAQQYQDLPFEMLVDALQPERSSSHTPLFQVLFNHQRQGALGQRRLDEHLHMVLVERERRAQKFDLTLSTEHTAAGAILASLGYSADVFERSTVVRMQQHYLAVLGQVLAQPQRPLAQVQLLDAEQQQGLLQAGQGGAVDVPADSVLQLFDRQVCNHPAAIALMHGGQAYTFAWLDQAATRVANQLMAQGCQPGERVPLLCGRTPAMVVGLLGVMKTGAAYVPLEPDLAEGRLLQILQDIDARRLLACVERPALGVPVLRLDACMAATGMAVPVNDVPHPQQPAYLIFTSGSTGRPKGVVVSHEALANYVQGVLQRLALAPEASMAMVSTVAADLGHTVLFGALCSGRTLHLLDADQARDPHLFADYLSQHRVGVLKIVPSHLHSLLVAGHEAASLPWHALILGGEACDAALLQRIALARPDCRLFNHYGPSEATVGVLAHDVQDLHARAPLGRPLANSTVHVLDADLNLLPVGVAGDLYIGGAGLAQGYQGQPGQSAERFVPNPFGAPGSRLYRSGDRVRWNANGELEYLGRQDHQVKVRGFRIELSEVQAQIVARPAVQQCAVIFAAGQLLAYVVLAADASLEALKAELSHYLPDYMQPAHWQVLATLPVTANGKLDTHALPSPAVQAQVFQAPANADEQRLAQLWQDLLCIEQVSRDGHFFELGGHSLLATQMVARVREQFDVVLPLRDVFDAPRLDQLAARIGALMGQQGTDAPALLVAQPRTGVLPLSLAQQRLWVVDRLSGGASDAYNMSGRLQLDGPLDCQRLAAALDLLVARHEVLRSHYPEDEHGDPYTCIVDGLSVDVPYADLSMLADDEREQLLRQASVDDARQPFDLLAGPLLRARLLRLGEQRHVLLFSLHHIVGDGWSVGILIREFAQAYRALGAGRAPQWAPLPVQYADFALYQQRWLASPAFVQEREFWQARLADAPRVLELPGDFARPAQASTAGAVRLVRLEPALYAQIEAHCRTHGVTPFMWLLASFQWLLHRVAKCDDLVIGTDLAGRQHQALEGLIGFFVNVLPLRSQVSPGMTFDALLAQARDSALATFEHQQLPFDRIVEAVGVPRDRSRNPLVQVLFVLQNTPKGQFDIDGLHIERLEALEHSSKFDMGLFLEPQDGGVLVRWTYASALFSAPRVQRLAQDWLKLIALAIASPHTPLEEFIVQDSSEMPVGREAPPMGNKLDKLKKFMKQPAAKPQGPRELVKTRPVQAERVFPLLIEPAIADLDALAWAAGHRDQVEALLRRHGGLVLRNFGITTPADFEAFAEALQPGLYGAYGDLPKKEGGKNTYRSTPFPERQMILYHNESAHLDRWPRKQWFFCELPSAVGGCTPIVDCRELYRRLPAEVAQTFEQRGLLYVRTFLHNLDVSWQHFFKTDDRAEVEARCEAGGIDYVWLDDDQLQTRTRAPAVIVHPLTGERSFFNQVQLHHIFCLDRQVRSDLLEMVGLEHMPRNVYYGDGSPIEDEVMELLGRLYEECAVRFDWQQGDVVMLDNMIAAHARDPYEGPRKIVVAMGDMYDRARLQQERTALAKSPLEAVQ
ncbi:amino acid adenylation domain-containing protein [Pseudomonas sp.]|uniref:amino acid adenylation domain-containing protein n=1 Tax=Pseudomonas sp. TaxID=306 RepID=UPI003CC61838